MFLISKKGKEGGREGRRETSRKQSDSLEIYSLGQSSETFKKHSFLKPLQTLDDTKYISLTKVFTKSNFI